MERNEPVNIPVRFKMSRSNLRWLEEMEQKGISKSSVINLAIEILQPRIETIGTTNERIMEAILLKSKIDF